MRFEGVKQGEFPPRAHSLSPISFGWTQWLKAVALVSPKGTNMNSPGWRGRATRGGRNAKETRP